MTARQRRLPLALIIGVVLAVFAIEAMTGTPSPRQPSAGEATTTQPTASPSPFALSDPMPRIGIVYDRGGPGGDGIGELARDGVKRAADGFGAEFKAVTGRSDDSDADREARLRELADARYYPIFAVGSAYAGPLARVAPKYPGTWFGIVDDGTVDAPNVIGIQFNDEQGAFLVGAAAALTSKTGSVGFIGGVGLPLIEKLEAGFTAGVRAVNPGVEVQVAYLSRPSENADLTDPAKARKAALRMYDAGADVIFAAAGDASSGVVGAAHDRGLWAIGADSDQFLTVDPSVRGAVLTSMLKRADVAAYAITMEVATGIPKDGNNVFGVGRDAVGYATSGGFVDPIRGKLDALAAKIASGTILVPTKP